MTPLLVTIAVAKIALVFFVVLTVVAYLTFAERRLSAFIQDRYGPNRVGPSGFLQPLADGIKFIFKEDIIPPKANKTMYIMAPGVRARHGPCRPRRDSHRKGVSH